MGKYITILAAIISVVIGVVCLGSWWWSFVELFKGCLPPILILGGIAAFFAAVNGLKEAKAVKTEQTKPEEEKNKKKTTKKS